MNLFTRSSPYYHLLKYLLFLLKHPVYMYSTGAINAWRFFSTPLHLYRLQEITKLIFLTCKIQGTSYCLNGTKSESYPVSSAFRVPETSLLTHGSPLRTRDQPVANSVTTQHTKRSGTACECREVLRSRVSGAQGCKNRRLRSKTSGCSYFVLELVTKSRTKTVYRFY
jgi:hypothetical protein